MKIYTKTGDKGETGLLGTIRVSKDSLRIVAIGEVDELNAALGFCLVESKGTELEEPLLKIQNWLFDLGSELASPHATNEKLVSVDGEHIGFLESSMDQQTEKLESLKNFILPGGSELASRLHLARCVCRRVERNIVSLIREEGIRADLLIFINRLSDWLFVSARTANHFADVEDIKWSYKLS